MEDETYKKTITSNMDFELQNQNMIIYHAEMKNKKKYTILS